MEVLINVKNISNATRHTSSKVAASVTEDDDSTTGHVFATVIANSFYNSVCTGVSDSKSFSCNSSEIAGTTRSTVQADIANENVLLSLKNCTSRRINDQSTARKAFAHIIVRITFQLQCHAGCKKGYK